MSESELQRLRRENERLRTEVAFLGKVQALRDKDDGKGPRRHRPQGRTPAGRAPGSRKAARIDVLPSPGPPSQTPEALRRELFKSRRYGHRSINEEQWKRRRPCATGAGAGRKRYNSYRQPAEPMVRSQRTEQKWVTDVTEFRVGDQKLYLPR